MRINERTTRNSLIWALIAVFFFGAARYSEADSCLFHTTVIAVVKGSAPIEGLTAADFRVTVGGKATAVQSVVPADRSPRVIIFLDASANQDQSTWAITRAIAEEFLAGFPDGGDFTLLAFDDKVQRVVHESNRGALQGALGEMFPSGKRESAAGLAEAVKKAGASLDGPRQGDAEFLITTSDQISKETAQTLSQQRAAGIRLFGVSFDQSTHPAPPPFDLYMTVEDYSPLGAAAKASGGRWIWFDMSRQDATARLQSARASGKTAAILVQNYFTLDLRLDKPLTKPEKLKIELTKSPRIDAKDISTSYPQELFPCH
jgi:hypothetical protein